MKAFASQTATFWPDLGNWLLDVFWMLAVGIWSFSPRVHFSQSSLQKT
jgi:hypothetical protein